MLTPISRKPPDLTPESQSRIFFTASLAMAALFAVAQVGFVGINNDTQKIIFYALHTLREGGLYDRWLEINSPPIVVIFMLPAYISEHWNINPSYALYGVTGIACALSLLSLHCALKYANASVYQRRIWVALAAFALFVLPASLNVYADREHWLFVLALPWIIEMLCEQEPPLYIILPAAIGFCIKPYDLAIPVILLLMNGKQSLIKRMTSRSAVTFTAFLLVYLILLATVFSGYIHTILPLAFFAYVNVTMPASIKAMRFIFLLPSLVILLLSSRKIANPTGWIGFIAGTLITYWANGGWDYTTYLIFVPQVLLCGYVLAQGVQLKIHPLAASTAGVALGGVIFLSCFMVYGDIDSTGRTGFAQNYHHLTPALYKDLREQAGARFILLSPTLWASNLETIDGSRDSVFAYDDFPWSITWLYANYPYNPRSADIMQKAISTPLLTAMRKYPSAPLIVDESELFAAGLRPHSDIMAFLRRDDTLAAALDDYTKTQTIDHCDVKEPAGCKYSIWRRKEAHAP